MHLHRHLLELGGAVCSAHGPVGMARSQAQKPWEHSARLELQSA